MPFNVVKQNSRAHFSEVQINLTFIASQEPQEITAETPIPVKILRGLYYVHLYSAMEKSINETIEQSLLLINSQSVRNKHYKTAFNVISLNQKMQGFRDSGNKEFLKKSAAIFNAIGSEEVFEISNTIFANNLQNVWAKTLQQTIECFGIQELQLEPSLVTLINEIVNNRNAVAHGRESPKTVGERHRADVLRQKTQQIQIAVDLFIGAFETHITEKLYIKDEYRSQYQSEENI